MTRTPVPVKVGDWIWVQDYVCQICGNVCAFGFLDKALILETIECENCACLLQQVELAKLDGGTK